MSEAMQKIDQLIAEQRERWANNDCVSVETLAAGQAWIAKDPSMLLDLIYSEVLIREDRLENPTEEEYLLRFPQLRIELLRQFQIHRAMQVEEVQEAQPGLEEVGAGLANGESGGVRALPRIPGFELLEVAGRGGNGVAYRAMDKDLRRVVAVKLLDITGFDTPSRPGQLMREAEAAAALKHPGIVQIFQVGEAEGSPFLVMEYLSGGSLAERLRKGPLPIAEAVDLTIRIAEAVEYAHTQGVIHRDLKPANVLLDGQNEPHVCDFGLARRLDSETSMHVTGDILGTPAYMPPEQARGERVDERADIYAIGAILYESLTGRPPFQAATPWEILHQVMTNDTPPLRQLNATLPKDLETICQKCLHKDRYRRYDSAAEIARELGRFRSGVPILARPVGRVQRFGKWVRRNPVLSISYASVTVALMAVAAVSWISREKVSAALTETERALEVAEGQRDVAVAAMNTLVYRAHDQLTKREASLEARAEVLQSAIEGLTSIASQAGDREDTRLTLATAHSRYAFILSQLGRMEEAESQHYRSVELSETLSSEEGQQLLAHCCSSTALFFVRTARFDKVEEWARKTKSLAGPLVEKNPEQPEWSYLLAQAGNHLASAASVTKTPVEAIGIRREAQELSRQLHAKWPDKPEYRAQLIDLNLTLIQDCLTLQYATEAKPLAEATLLLIEPSLAESSEDVQARSRYYWAMRCLGVAEQLHGRFDSAIESLQMAHDGYAKLVAIEPDRPAFRLKLGEVHEQLALSFMALNRLDDCDRHARGMIDELTRGMELGGPTYQVQRFPIARGWFLIADVGTRRNQLGRAIDAWRNVNTLLQPVKQQFGLQGTCDQLAYLIEVGSGVDGKKSVAEVEDIAKLRRVLEAWRSLEQGESKLFCAGEEEMKADIAAMSPSLLRANLMAMHIACQGLYHGHLVRQSTDDQTAIQEVETRCIASIQAFESDSNGDPLLHLRLPDLVSLRQTERFQKAFPVR